MTLCRRYSQELDAANIADARTTLYVVIGRSTSIGKQQLASDARAPQPRWINLSMRPLVLRCPQHGAARTRRRQRIDIGRSE